MVLSVAADGTPSAASPTPWLETSAEELQAAARFYVARILFDGSSDDYRMFGSNGEKELEGLRANRRLLLLWLHPDKSDDPALNSLFIRMNEAWDRIRAGAPRLFEANVSLGHRRSGRSRPSRHVAVRSGRILVPRRPARRTRRRTVVIVAGLAATLLGLSVLIGTSL